jgi:hypothetical protein
MGFQFEVMFIDSFMDDVTYVRDVEVRVERMFVTHRGAFAMALRILDRDLCMMTVLDLLVQPHISIPQLHIGFITAL